MPHKRLLFRITVYMCVCLCEYWFTLIIITMMQLCKYFLIETSHSDCKVSFSWLLKRFSWVLKIHAWSASFQLFYYWKKSLKSTKEIFYPKLIPHASVHRSPYLNKSKFEFIDFYLSVVEISDFVSLYSNLFMIQTFSIFLKTTFFPFLCNVN